MSDIHLLTAIAKQYAKLGKRERVQKIKKLVNQSSDNEDFLRKFFPDLYEEAFPNSRAVGASWESDQRPALSAKPR